jgi:predicted RNA-binding protein (virulence factor B family)
MVIIGKFNRLTVLRETDIGVVLDGDQLGEILLPCRYAPVSCRPGDELEVFLMLDSEDRLIATTDTPLATVNEFAFLRVVSVTEIGAFLDWGLPKDLLVPFREQKVKMCEGRSYVVRIYFDEVSGRIAASAKLDRYLDQTPARYREGERVELLICNKTDLGYKAIVNGTHWGMIFFSDIFQPIATGQELSGYIKQMRPDGKINLSLQKPGTRQIGDLTDEIVEYLQAHGGFMLITDKSDPDDIYRAFGVSKKNYKRAIGALYKQRRIDFEEGGTKLID